MLIVLIAFMSYWISEVLVSAADIIHFSIRK
jgi:hypothetical protein